MLNLLLYLIIIIIRFDVLASAAKNYQLLNLFTYVSYISLSTTSNFLSFLTKEKGSNKRASKN